MTASWYFKIYGVFAYLSHRKASPLMETTAVTEIKRKVRVLPIPLPPPLPPFPFFVFLCLRSRTKHWLKLGTDGLIADPSDMTWLLICSPFLHL